MRTTFMANANNVERDWYIIDASGQTLGRLATQVATILRGKHKAEFTPHVDTGDHVVVINCAEVVLTGNKIDQKKYYNHSGYTGGLRVRTAKEMLQNSPDEMVYKAIKGMLPHNKLGAAQLKKLRVYKGAEHEQQAQNPKVWEIK